MTGGMFFILHRGNVLQTVIRGNVAQTVSLHCFLLLWWDELNLFQVWRKLYPPRTAERKLCAPLKPLRESKQGGAGPEVSAKG